MREKTAQFVKLGIEVITYEYSKFNLYFSAKKIAKNIQLQQIMEQIIYQIKIVVEK